MIIQILFTGFFITYFLRLIFKSLGLDMRKSIFVVPLFFFYGRNITLKTNFDKKYDKVSLKVRTMFFFINPLYLFIGKLRISFCYINSPHMNYLNRIPSFKKIKYLPKPNRVTIGSLYLRDGNFEIEDHSVFPVYKVHVQNLALRNSMLDFGIPFKIFFTSKYAYCNIGSGHVLASRNGKIGKLEIVGVTWGEIISLDGLPLWFLKNHLNLHSEFISLKNETHLVGLVHFEKLVSAEGEEVKPVKKIEFSFRIFWKDYNLPFDLALKKSISELMMGLNYTGIFTFTFRIIAGTINNLFLKAKENPKEEA